MIRIGRLGFGAAFALIAFSAPAVADVKAGVDAWDRGEYKKAVEEWRPLAIAGDADAQFDLGQAYKLGRGVPVDFGLAEEWYRKAALQGHVRAEDAYGLALFQNGKRAEAVPWLERSVARGEPRAQLVLGTMLFNGDNVKRDYVRAYALLTRSSAAGLPQGSQTLAQMDQYISADVRQKGIALARDYEAQAQRPAIVPEVAGEGSRSTLRGTELPASTYAGDADTRPALVQAPVPAVASRTAPPRPASGAAKGWRIQFGAFRDDSNARALWQDLQASVGALDGFSPIYAKSGTLTKLQTGPLASGGDAARLCASVKAKMSNTPCVPVAP